MIDNVLCHSFSYWKHFFCILYERGPFVLSISLIFHSINEIVIYPKNWSCSSKAGGDSFRCTVYLYHTTILVVCFPSIFWRYIYIWFYVLNMHAPRHRSIPNSKCKSKSKLEDTWYWTTETKVFRIYGGRTRIQPEI